MSNEIAEVSNWMRDEEKFITDQWRDTVNMAMESALRYRFPHMNNIQFKLNGFTYDDNPLVDRKEVMRFLVKLRKKTPNVGLH